MDFDWGVTTIPWETTTDVNKAPMGCTVSIKFKPIHDITPGLDAYGINRAPVYGVGSTSNNLRGKPFYEGYRESSDARTRAIERVKNKPKADG